ncbi:HdeD family acid-resistance protein [Anaerosphaera multitolerans]|uniref:HdeD family acid-resistance protein n=1 Tax=Anaerosphaera multitolerans TaxID=2487351 RepID=A0A437S7J9_9FIRM|nr:DUF308 domain-containing protein [Anaerosphaera multitolerans]RVU55033.1 hypothetical protein EF514_03850 [Anaerosphaera multitolerans]
MKNLKNAKWISLIMGALLILGGIIFLSNPLSSLLSLVYVIAAVFIATGILRILRYFTDSMFKTGSFLILGILDVILGIAMVYSQPLSAITLSIFLGFWEIVSGVSEIAISIDLKKSGFPRWWLGLALGILGVILGIMFINNPALPIIYIGIYMVMYGVTFISTFFGLLALERKFKR